MITVTAPLWLWAGENGSWHFITVPEESAGEIRAHAMAPFAASDRFVEAKSSGYILPVKADVRRKTGIAPEDPVTVTLELL